VCFRTALKACKMRWGNQAREQHLEKMAVLVQAAEVATGSINDYKTSVFRVLFRLCVIFPI
jgi:hypothetical protein